MRKLREDSTWNQLTAEQLETLEVWLFDENLGYEKTIERVREEFGLESTVASLGRYYRRRAPEWQAEELIRAQLAANDLNDQPVNADELRAAILKLVAKATLKVAIEQPAGLQQLASLTKLLLDSEANDLRRARIKLDEKYFDLEAIASIQPELPRLKAYMTALASDTNKSEDEKMKSIRTILFHLVKVSDEDKPEPFQNGK